VFHHPWNEEDDHDLEAAASAILGAYLGELGMNDRAVWFMTRKGKDSGEFLTEDISRELGIGAVFTGTDAASNQAPQDNRLVRGAKLLVCRLNRANPYASGESCTEATAEYVQIADVPPIYCTAWVLGNGNEFGAPLDRYHGLKVDCGSNIRQRLR
jgi:hypothetical protein